MTAFIIIGCILLFISVLLLAPVSVRAELKTHKYRLRVSYLFAFYTISPEANERREIRSMKKAAKKEKKPKPPEQKEKEKKEPGKASAKGIWEIVWTLLRSSRKSVDIIRRHFIIVKPRINLAVSRSDAHKTAIAYGQVCVFTSVLLALLGEVFVLRDPRACIMPDFTGGRTRYDISFRAQIRPLFVLAAVLRVAATIFRLYMAIQGNTKQKNNKGGHQHESATSRK